MYKKLAILAAALLTTLLLFAPTALSHCEIPCGIYGDRMRTEMIAEHIRTVEKSMNQIKKLAEASPPNYNQLVRWIDNKETHAAKIQDVAAQYFLHQRIKPDGKNYEEKLKTLHAILIEAMKCKQTVDLAHVEELRRLLAEFEKLYFEHDHE